MSFRVTRRVVAGAAIIGGALLMWLSPESLAGGSARAGLLLMGAGIVLEIVGIALERRR